MIKGKHNFFVVRFFDWYIKGILQKDFKAINLEPDNQINQKQPVLLVGNHFSWWDGFFAYYLNAKLFKKKFNVMMLEKELKKRIIFSKAGAFSVAPGESSRTESLDYACDLLEYPDNLVLIFPQGKIQSQYEQDFTFGWGLDYILRKNKKGQLVFFAAFSDYFSHRKPSVTIYCRKINEVNNSEAEYNTFFRECRLKFLESNKG